MTIPPKKEEEKIMFRNVPNSIVKAIQTNYY